MEMVDEPTAVLNLIKDSIKEEDFIQLLVTEKDADEN